MGNQICCDQSHQKPTEIQKLESEVVQKISIVERSDENEENHHHHQEEVIEQEREPQIQEVFEPKHEQPVHSPPEIELPQLWPRVSEAINTHHFFEQELSGITKYRRKYGEDVYEGQLDQEKVKPNGLGRMFKQDGSLYVGYFSHGRAHGRGVYIFHNGSFYNGQFNQNRAETSAGVKGYYQSELLKYEGGFQNNTFHGHGVETGDNYTFEGQYGSGFRAHGKFTWKAADGKYVYEGYFNEKNNFHGKGVLHEPHGVYDGDFVNGQKHGEGYYHSKNGTKYRGSYANNERNGKGTVFNSDDTIAYQGELKNGLPHGKGKVKSGNDYIEATWVEGIDATLIPE